MTPGGFLAALAEATGSGTNTTANAVAAVAATATLMTSLSLLIPALLQLRKVHTIVNQISTDKDRRIIALSTQIVEAGLIPVRDQAMPVPGQPDAQPGQPS